MTERCGHWMPRAQEYCGRGAGHAGQHRHPQFKAQTAAYRWANRERIRAAKKAYYDENHELILAQKKQYRESEAGIAVRTRYVEMGYAAETNRRQRQRKADEADNRLEKELLGWLV